MNDGVCAEKTEECNGKQAQDARKKATGRARKGEEVGASEVVQTNEVGMSPS